MGGIIGKKSNDSKNQKYTGRGDPGSDSKMIKKLKRQNKINTESKYPKSNNLIIDDEKEQKKEAKTANQIREENETQDYKDNNYNNNSKKKTKKEKDKKNKEAQEEKTNKENKENENESIKNEKKENYISTMKKNDKIYKCDKRKGKKRNHKEKTIEKIKESIHEDIEIKKDEQHNNSSKGRNPKLSLYLNDSNENLDIQDFYLLDTYESIKDKKTYKIEDTFELIVIYYFNNQKKFHIGLYRKKEFTKTYEFIFIYCNSVTLRFLFPKYKYSNKNITENDIMKELKNSLCCGRIEEIFYINLKSKRKNYYLKKVNNSNNNMSFVLLFEPIIPENNNKNCNNNIMLNKVNNKIIVIQKKKKDTDKNNQINDNNDYSNQSNKNDDIITIKNNTPHDDKNMDNNIPKQISDNNSNKINDSTTPGNKDINDKIDKNIIKNIDNNESNSKGNTNIKNIINKNNISEEQKVNDKDKDNNTIIFSDKIIIFNNNQVNQNIQNIQNNNINKIELPYFFPLIGLDNLGSTCFMNATLQCLIHIQEISLYFLDEYPKDKDVLNSKNIDSETQGKLSEAYYSLIKNIQDISLNKEIKKPNYFYLKNFHKTLGKYNEQFAKNEANDSKDLITYLFQSFHSELNYFGDNNSPNKIPLPDSSIRELTYNYFIQNYNIKNFSKISQIFYGTYEIVTKCLECKTKYYSYQKFEIMSFSTYFYRNKKFQIMDGFKDVESTQKLFGDNKYFCNKCNKLVNAEMISKILELPLKLILNIDYGKNKINDIKQLFFDEEIDLKEYLSLFYGQKTKYKLCAVCTHIGSSGQSGHYITFCLDKRNNEWYKFNDSSCKRIKDKSELKKNSPYLLIYEQL